MTSNVDYVPSCRKKDHIISQIQFENKVKSVQRAQHPYWNSSDCFFPDKPHQQSMKFGKKRVDAHHENNKIIYSDVECKLPEHCPRQHAQQKHKYCTNYDENELACIQENKKRAEERMANRKPNIFEKDDLNTVKYSKIRAKQEYQLSEEGIGPVFRSPEEQISVKQRINVQQDQFNYYK